LRRQRWNRGSGGEGVGCPHTHYSTDLYCSSESILVNASAYLREIAGSGGSALKIAGCPLCSAAAVCRCASQKNGLAFALRAGLLGAAFPLLDLFPHSRCTRARSPHLSLSSIAMLSLFLSAKPEIVLPLRDLHTCVCSVWHDSRCDSPSIDRRR
jgi:hypothetical protein